MQARQGYTILLQAIHMETPIRKESYNDNNAAKQARLIIIQDHHADTLTEQLSCHRRNTKLQCFVHADATRAERPGID